MKKVAILISILVIAGCTTFGEQQVLNREVMTEMPTPRPKWVTKTPPSTNREIFIVGVSDNFASEKRAREDALYQCIKNFALSCQVEVEASHEFLGKFKGKSDETINPEIFLMDRLKLFVNAFVRSVTQSSTYIQKFDRYQGNTYLETYWKAHTLVSVPSEERQRVISEYQTWINEKYMKNLKLYFRKENDHLFLFWNSQGRIEYNIRIQKKMNNGRYGVVDEIFNPADSRYYLENVDWGDSYKISVRYGNDNWVDSNSIVIHDVCSAPADIFYQIYDESGDSSNTLKMYFQDFEDALTRAFDDNSLSFQKRDANCARRILLLSIYKIDTSRGYRINARDLLTGNLFLKGSYNYDTLNVRMASGDKGLLAEKIASFFSDY